jgi:NAD(P)-dependent dehydrogenase (short-subunit alcohol dehydrogenase family)
MLCWSVAAAAAPSVWFSIFSDAGVMSHVGSEMAQQPPDIFGVRRRVFVILGAGQGIGYATATVFASAGARLVCVDREPALAEAVARQIAGLAITGDVTNRADMKRIFAEAAKWAGGKLAGAIDIVGIADVRSILEFDDASWDRQFDLNLRHAYLTMQESLPHLDRDSSLVFVSSLAGSKVCGIETVYGAAKAALDHLVRGAAVEFGPRGIRVNAVAPGFVRTPRLNAALSEEFWTGLKSYIPMGGAAEPEDIAGPLLFLSSRLASNINGVVLPVDGGVSVKAAIPEIPFKGQATRAR